MGRGGGASSKLKKAAKKVLVAACGSLSLYSGNPPALPSDPTILGSSPTLAKPLAEEFKPTNADNTVAPKNLCAICLEALSSRKGEEAIFTAQCSHSFHLSCISSNIRHGSITCPICRAHWTQLPRNLHPPPCAFSQNHTDPIFRILDDSIATFRFHRRSLLRSAQCNNDDPIDTTYNTTSHDQFSRLDFSLSLAACPSMPKPPALPFHHYHQNHLHNFRDPTGSSVHLPHSFYNVRTPAYLSVKLSTRKTLDLVLVASANGPLLRLSKQAMALVVFSLGPIDRLAIVTSSLSAAQAFPLRQMTTAGKRAALQVIDRLFHTEEADPAEDLKQGIKILEDRAHKSIESFILHLLDCPARTVSYGHSIVGAESQIPMRIHRFHLGFGLGNGTSNRLIMQEFEDLLASLVGCVIRDVQLRIGEEGRVVRLGELRRDEERKILVELGEGENVGVGYSYVEGGGDAARGERVVSLGHNKAAPQGTGNGAADDEVAAGGSSNAVMMGVGERGRTSSVEGWGNRDPFMAMRWAKHLHGYRL